MSERLRRGGVGAGEWRAAPAGRRARAEEAGCPGAPGRAVRSADQAPDAVGERAAGGRQGEPGRGGTAVLRARPGPGHSPRGRRRRPPPGRRSNSPARGAPGRHPPDRRVIEEQGLHRGLEQVHQIVVPRHMGQLMGEDRLELPRREPASVSPGPAPRAAASPPPPARPPAADSSRATARLIPSRSRSSYAPGRRRPPRPDGRPCRVRRLTRQPASQMVRRREPTTPTPRRRRPPGSHDSRRARAVRSGRSRSRSRPAPSRPEGEDPSTGFRQSGRTGQTRPYRGLHAVRSQTIAVAVQHRA